MGQIETVERSHMNTLFWRTEGKGHQFHQQKSTDGTADRSQHDTVETVAFIEQQSGQRT